MAHIQEAKASLRLHFRQRRDSLDEHRRRIMSQQAEMRLLTVVQHLGPRVLGLYAAMGSEASTANLYHSLHDRGVGVAFPRVVAARKRLEFVQIDSWDELRPGYSGISEPQGESVGLTELDLIVVPGLGFDRQGGRIGYGAGFYDRTLAEFPHVALGFGFHVQLVAELPNGPLDHPLDGVVTNEETHWTPQGAARGFGGLA